MNYILRCKRYFSRDGCYSFFYRAVASENSVQNVNTLKISTFIQKWETVQLHTYFERAPARFMRLKIAMTPNTRQKV